MTLAQYLESQRGKTYTQIIAEQPTETVQGSLLKVHYQELKTILGAGGLRLHLDNFVADSPEKAFALSAVKETFTEQYMADADFKVNFTVPKVLDTFNATVALGVIPAAIAQELLDLAKYQRSVFNVTRDICADYFGTGWLVLPATDALQLLVNLEAQPPEQTYIQVQMSDVYPDETTSAWYTCTSLSGLFDIRRYKAKLRHEGYPRLLRWRCEYPLTVTVTVA